MPEFGLLKGLSADLGYDNKINDLRYHEQQNQRALAENEAKTKLFADDLDYQNAANSHDAPIIRENAKNKIKEIGRYVRENPDWQYNVDKRVQLNLLKKDLKDNPDLQRGIATDTAYKSYLGDLQKVAKNPNNHNARAYENIGKEYNNYLQYGNQGGLDALQREGKKAFLYTKPQDFIDENELYRKNGSAIQAKGIEYLKNGRDDAYQTYATKQDLENEAKAIYAAHPDQFNQRYKEKGLDPIQEISKGLNGYVKTDFKIGEKNHLGEQIALENYKHKLKQAISTPGSSPYKITVLDANYAKAPADLLGQTFGSKIPHSLPAGKDNVPIDNTGDIFNYDGDIHDKGYRTDGKYKKTGIKTVHGYVYKPLDFGKEVGYTKDPWGFGEDEVLPEYKDQVSIVDSPMNSEGKSHKVLKIKTQADVNANDPSYQGRYDKEISTTKQRDEYGVNSSQMNNGTFNGLPIGNIVERNGKRYIVTKEGLEEQ